MLAQVESIAVPIYVDILVSIYAEILVELTIYLQILHISRGLNVQLACGDDE